MWAPARRTSRPSGFHVRVGPQDWNDQDCLRILASVRTAMGTAKCTLLIVEAVLLGSLEDAVYQKPLLDLNMMVSSVAACPTSSRHQPMA